ETRPADSSSPLMFDPTSPDNFANPYPMLRLIQERELLHRSKIGWMVTRYELATTLLRESRVWGGGVTPEHRRAMFGPGPMLEYASRRMNGYNPPEHTRLRSLVTKAFTARRVEAQRPRIQKLADQLLNSVQGTREFDVLETLAHPLPCQVICEMIGVPLSDSPQLSDWTGAVHSVLAPIAQPERMPAANQAAGEFMSYIRALVTKRRAAPGEDLLTALIAAEEEGERLTEEELIATVLFIFTAGHATTRDLVGSGLLAFMNNRDQWDRLVSDPSMVSSAVEECLRYAPSVPLTMRRALLETTLAGTPISAGEAVLVSIAAANRDPRRFPDPDRFDIGRADNEHLTFGGGIHFCLGAMLARAEAQIIFATLVRRYPKMELAEQTIEWRDTVMFRGPKAVRVKV
ncbi:MAG TPA: cytochrome P450, partial [Candidatus Acidoferrum sp.]|nr:cytochrome P450 [Candidatus Acidoferrum sp.]